MDTHKNVHCGGVSKIIHYSPTSSFFWYSWYGSVLKGVLRCCVPCRKSSGKPYKAPNPPPLPKFLVTEAPPFTITGMDFTGVLFVKEGEHEKVYICLFTCAVTRAVNLEVVGDLTFETFLLANRKFSSRKPLPRKIILGNASVYLSAAEEIQKLLQSKSFKGASNGNFIPKQVPWYGVFCMGEDDQTYQASD